MGAWDFDKFIGERQIVIVHESIVIHAIPPPCSSYSLAFCQEGGRFQARKKGVYIRGSL